MTWNRGWIELAHAPGIAPRELPADGWPAGPTVRVLSRDEQDGDLTGVLSLPAGYRRPAGHLTADTELFVLSGVLRIGEESRGFGYYEFAPAGSAQEQWVVDDGCELLLMARTGAPNLVPEPGAEAPGRISLDTERIGWQMWEIEGPPVGTTGKLLRHVEETGETLALFAVVPEWWYPKLEWHDCIEEIYCLGGDIWLGNAGTMTRGSYLWRPPYITHGPFRSEDGCLMLVWVNEPLVNHFADDPSTTPEENRRTAVSA